MANRIKIYETLQRLTCFINCICTDPSVWQSVLVFTILSPSHAAIKISINATAAEFICKNIFPIPVQIKKIIKNKTGDIQQIYLYQNVCK